MIDAFHLPGLDASAVDSWHVLSAAEGVELRVPALQPRQLTALLERLRRARESALAPRPVGDVVAAIDAAAAILLDPASPERRLADRHLPAVTGFSPAMARLVLERMAQDWRRAALETLLEADLGHAEALDRFVPRAAAGGLTRAFGPRLAFHVFAGNVPGVAVTSIVRSLLVKAATLGKTASGEPLLPVLFARALARVAPALADCLAVTYWPGGTEPLETVALEAADTVVVYGGEEVETDVRRRLPAGTRLVSHGPRVSFGMIGREALAQAAAGGTADEAARAAALFDQQGCVSPHLFYVEEGGDVSPEGFAELLHRELGRLEETLPRGRLSAAEAAAVLRERAAAEFAGIGGRDVRLLDEPGAKHVVIYEGDPAFTPSCLNRVVRIKPVSALEDVAALVGPFAAYLQTVGMACSAARRTTLAASLGKVGVSRVATLRQLPWPAAAGHHDGRGPLLELVRWVDLEPPDEDGPAT